MHLRGAIPASAAALALALAWAGTAAAHEPASSNGVTASLHVTPGDTPIAGQPATIAFVEVRTKAGLAFSWKTCGCTLAVLDAEGKQLLRSPALGKPVAYVFPAVGAYQIALAGRARQGKAWKAFRLLWTLRADTAEAVANGSSD